jgi:Tfp pilus assembly major pilin PilA
MSAQRARAASAAQRGVTLIELIAFIVIMGISVVALLSMYRAVLPRGDTPAEITLATQLAQERMELILGQRVARGYSPVISLDPCPGAAICTPTTGYSVIVNGVSPPVLWSDVTGNYRQIGVKVLGPDGTQLANLSAVIANY